MATKRKGTLKTKNAPKAKRTPKPKAAPKAKKPHGMKHFRVGRKRGRVIVE